MAKTSANLSESNSPLLKINQAANFLGVSKDTLRRWEKSGKLASFRSPSGYRLYSLEQVQKVRDGWNASKEDLPQFQPMADLTNSDVIPDGTITHLTLPLKRLVQAGGSILGVSAVVTGIIAGIYLTNPTSTKQTVSSPLLAPFDTLAKDAISLALPNKAKELGLASQGLTLRGEGLSSKQSFSMSKPELGAVLAATSPSEAFLQINTDTNISGKLTINGDTVVTGKLLGATNIISTITAGSNITISGTSTNPSISATVPAPLAGTDISITTGAKGNTISDTSTLSSVRGRGGCSSCITDDDVSNVLTISSGGSVEVGAIKGTFPTTQGGTGITSYAAGDMIYASTANTLSNLVIGTNGQFLSVSAGIPAWTNLTTLPTSLTQGSVIFAGPTGTLSEDNSKFFYDETTHRLGLGTTTPGSTLDINGTANISTSLTSPLLIGGTTTTSPLTLRSTSGVGTTGADIIFQTGNNGATEAMRILNSGNVGIGVTNPNNLVQVANLIDFDNTLFNTFLGYQAGHGNTTGTTNTAVGYQALYSSTTDGTNTAVGYRALYNANVGGLFLSNTAVGYQALYSDSSGDKNTAVGISAGTSVSTGSSNTFLGYSANVGSSSLSNATAIGSLAEVGCSNCLVLGSVNGVNGATNNVNIGIGTTSPTQLLDVAGTGQVRGDALVAGSLFTDSVEAPNVISDQSLRGTTTGNVWTEVGTNTFPQIGSDNVALAYKGKIFSIGGKNPSGTALAKVFSSIDGITWNEVGSNTLPYPVTEHQGVVFNGKMWIVGGYNSTAASYSQKVYDSTDGATWTEAGTNSFPFPIGDHAMAVFNGKMWVFGGYNATTGNDSSAVYSSFDGITWTHTGDLAQPLNAPTALSYDGKMWVMGGYTGSVVSNKTYYSTDGVTWTEAGTNSFPGSFGCCTQGVVFDGKMWVASGSRDLYYSTTGSSWTTITNAFPSTVNGTLNENAMVVFNGRMWTIGNNDCCGPGSGEKVFVTENNFLGPLVVRNNANTSELFRITDAGNVGIGTTSPTGLLDISKAVSATPSLIGQYLSLSASTLTDNSTAASGTLTNAAFSSIAAPTLAATNTSVTTTNAYTFYIAGNPLAGTNETITNPYALGVNGNAIITGSTLLSGASPLRITGSGITQAASEVSLDQVNSTLSRLASFGPDTSTAGILQLDTYSSNASVVNTVLVLQNGVQIGVPTGGDKGGGTLNVSSAYYVNGANINTGGTLSNVAYLNQANSFTLINPLTTIAESWIGPSSTTGIYFKGGNVGIGTTAPTQTLELGGNSSSLANANALIANSDTNDPAYRLSVAGPIMGEQLDIASRVNLMNADTYNGAAWTGWSTGVSPGCSTADSLASPTPTGKWKGAALRCIMSSGGNGIWAVSGAQSTQFTTGHVYRISFRYTATAPFRLQDRDDTFLTIPTNTGDPQQVTYLYTAPNGDGAGHACSLGNSCYVVISAPGAGTILIDEFTIQDLTSGTENYDLVVDPSGNVGIGTTAPGGTLSVVSTNATGTGTSSAINLTANSLTTGTALYLASTSITTGNFLDINNGSDIFSVSNTAVTNSLPFNETAAGDMALSYDLNFTNPTASYIKSAAPLYITAGETFNSSDLTLTTYNSGNINLQTASGTVWTTLGSTASTTALCSSLATSTSPTAGTLYEIRDCSGTPAADYMEFYPTNGDLAEGDLVTNSDQYATTNDGERISKVTKTTSRYQNNLIGVISKKSRAGDFNSIGYNLNSSDNPQPIALAGRVMVKVTNENGNIQKGDYITASSTAGFGMKSTQPASVVGIALEDWDPSQGNTMMVLVKPTFADPLNVLANMSLDPSGNIIMPAVKTNHLELSGVNTVTLATIESSLDPSTLNSIGDAVNSGSDSAHVDIATTINTILSAESNLQLSVSNLQSQTASTSAQIAGLASQGETLQGQIASQSAQLASASGQLASQSATLAQLSDDVTVLKLTPPSVLGASTSAQLTNLNVDDTTSTYKLSASDLTATEATVSGTLNVLGNASLGSTMIAGDLNIDGTFTVGTETGGNSINALTTLFIQNSPLAELVDFFNGLVTIDKTGAITAQSITANQINVKGSSTSGEATLTAGSTELAVFNSLVDSNSLVIITPETATSATIAVTDKVAGSGFVVKIPTVATSDIKFSYLIIGRK